ncbi:transcription termination factor Rho [Rhodococcus aerolatus]
MVLAELRTLAADMGIGDTAGMRKGDLIVAIKAQQGGGAGSGPAASAPAATAPAETTAPATTAPDGPADGATAPGDGATAPAGGDAADAGTTPRRSRQRRGASRSAGAPEQTGSPDAAEQGSREQGSREQDGGDQGSREQDGRERTDGGRDRGDSHRGDTQHGGAQDGRGQRPAQQGRDAVAEGGRQNGRPQQRDGAGERDEDRGPAERDDDRGPGRGQGGSQNSASQNGSSQNGSGQNGSSQNGSSQNAAAQNGSGQNGPGGQNGQNGPGDDEEGRGGRRGRRFRERRRGRDRGGDTAGGPQEERDPEVRDDDVLQPVAGILDVLDNYAFVRTSGYLAGPGDVYVSMGMVRKHGLRRGDAVTGAVRVPREGEQQGGGGRSNQKFNPLVRIDTINGGDLDAARKRPEFGKLTPLYPNQRLRLETTPNILTTRVIDLVMPIGKGQRALIVSPPKAGKTSVLQAIANAITVNNPECHLMVVLVDERPEEVTDMQRSVRGEVISSTFDRPPGDHTAVAELAIERAKRLVEGGKDVVVLLDSITRLGRAYNNSSPASGRILSGGVDSTALYPPKRFLGAARNIEHGGSLTIIATAMVETGSTGDTVIFEEFKGTGNAELKLDRKIAERRVFPAVDVNPSGTRKDELLLGTDEYAVTLKLRRVLSGLDSHQAIDLLIDRLRKSHSNAEFLMQVSKTAPSGPTGRDDEA